MIHQEIVVANITEAYDYECLGPDDRQEWMLDYRHLTGKALAWGHAARSALVTPWPIATELQAARAQEMPESRLHIVRVPLDGFSLSRAALRTPAALDELVAGFDLREPVELLYWVATEELAELASELVRRGLRITPAPEVISRSAGVERMMRRRHAMCEVLARIPEVAALRPGTRRIDSWDEVRAFLRDIQPGSRWVLKGTDSVAGCGVMIVDSEAERRRLAAAPTPTRPASEAGLYLRMQPPFVVEEMIGDRRTNLSPTLDIAIGPTPRVVGSGWQVLQGEAGYVGILQSGACGVPDAIATPLAQGLARELGGLGFAGACNVDLIVTTEGRWAVMEINVRRSSPIDHFASADRLGITAHPEQVAVSLDFLPTGLAARVRAVAARGEHGVVVRHRLGDEVTSATWNGVLLVAPTMRALVGFLEAVGYDGDDNLLALCRTALERATSTLQTTGVGNAMAPRRRKG